MHLALLYSSNDQVTQKIAHLGDALCPAWGVRYKYYVCRGGAFALRSAPYQTKSKESEHHDQQRDRQIDVGGKGYGPPGPLAVGKEE
jgi:hypothetical protein